MTNEVIDELYDFGLRNGASGGKLVGAGGGGFLLFQTDKKVELERLLTEQGARVVNFSIANTGTQVLTTS